MAICQAMDELRQENARLRLSIDESKEGNETHSYMHDPSHADLPLAIDLGSKPDVVLSEFDQKSPRRHPPSPPSPTPPSSMMASATRRRTRARSRTRRTRPTPAVTTCTGSRSLGAVHIHSRCLGAEEEERGGRPLR